MTSPGHVRTAAARQARTRAKHDRWIRELSAAGWTVIQASRVEAWASWRNDGTADLVMLCGCGERIGVWPDQEIVPLPKVLHAVTGHTCTEERSNG